MLTDYDDAGIGLAALMLSMNLLLSLKRKGLLTDGEVAEILEQALLNLETREAPLSPRNQAISRSARALVEELRRVTGDL